MALSANTVWEIRADATASNVNGGGFVTGASGTDYSQQTTAQYHLTGVASAGSGNTILSASAANDMVGNILHVVSGTNFTVGWFEITSVSVGVSITCSTNVAGSSICTGVGASGDIYIGGAMSLNSSLDDSFFEAGTAANTYWFRGAAGTLTLGQAVSISLTGSGNATLKYNGYNSTRGDTTIGSTRPVTIACGANAFTFSAAVIVSSIIFTGTAATMVTTTGVGLFYNCKFLNTSTTASRIGANAATGSFFHYCEFISQNGNAFSTGINNIRLFGCYAHDSSVGITFSSQDDMGFTIIKSCSAGAINLTSSTGNCYLFNNTIFGSAAKVGVGITIAANATSENFINNIIYGFATGISQTTAQQSINMGTYNVFFNNTTNATNYTVNSTDITATDPSFTTVTELTGSTATTSGSVLTQSGGDFSSVQDNVDFLRVTSGTGVTTGIYLITSHTSTTLTVNNALGTSSAGNVVWTVPTGSDLSIGTALKAAAFPGALIDSESTSYLDPGAVQRQESATSGSVGFVIL